MKLNKVIAVRTTKTIYRNGDKAIKVFNNDFSTSDVLNEALNHARVQEAGANVPQLHEVTKIDGKWAIIMDFIEGKTLDRLMEEEPEKNDEYMKLFVDIQLEMHKHTAARLNRLVEKMHNKIDQSCLDATARYELHARLNSLPEHKKLCHGDYNPSNIIITESGGVYIIDWSHATQGNASADAARTYLLFWLSGDINGAEQYMKLFCTKSDTARQYVDKWLSIVSASQLVKGKPEEREFLLHWANVTDFE